MLRNFSKTISIHSKENLNCKLKMNVEIMCFSNDFLTMNFRIHVKKQIKIAYSLCRHLELMKNRNVIGTYDQKHNGNGPSNDHCPKLQLTHLHLYVVWCLCHREESICTIRIQFQSTILQVQYFAEHHKHKLHLITVKMTKQWEIVCG